MKARKPIIELEYECTNARLKDLIDSFIYNPLLSRPYMLIRFHNTTSKKTKEKIRRYIAQTYDITSVELVADDSSIYIVYDFWKRFPSDY